MIIVVCDVCADIPSNVLEERNIAVMPMTLTVNGEERLYTPECFACEEFYDGMRKGDVCSTSQISREKYIEFFTPILERGDDIIYISLSSGHSGSYDASCGACEMLRESFPERKICSVDSLGASLGEGLLTLLVAKKVASGESFENVVEYAENIKHNVMLWFTVDDLKYLCRGGRVSKTSAVLGTILDIKPVLQCNSEGKLVPVCKVKGRKKSVKTLMEMLDKYGVDIDGQEICISHGDCMEDAILLQRMISEKYPACTFVFNHIGAVIGSHSGPGTLALFFVGEKRFI